MSHERVIARAKTCMETDICFISLRPMGGQACMIAMKLGDFSVEVPVLGRYYIEACSF